VGWKKAAAGMTCVHRRAARRELEGARILGVERKRYRQRYERAPDMAAVRLPSGDVLQPDAKTRGKLAKWIVEGLAQAGSYTPGAIPMLIISETGGAPIALMPLRDLARLLGLQPPTVGQQLALAPRCA
jgi:hypothetical protein